MPGRHSFLKPLMGNLDVTMYIEDNKISCQTFEFCYR